METARISAAGDQMKWSQGRAGTIDPKRHRKAGVAVDEDVCDSQTPPAVKRTFQTDGCALSQI